MNLLLDLGNSRCKFQIVENHQIKEHGALSYIDANKLAVIESLLREHKFNNKVIVCSVFDAMFNDQLIRLLNRYSIKDYYFLAPAAQTFGVRINYQAPVNLGADRLAVLIAANEKFIGNKCIVDCGTAITIDALDKKGLHHGGVILPGLVSMLQALTVDTDIQCSGSSEAYNVFSNATEDAIYTGCLSAVVGGIQHVIDTMQTHCDSFDHVVITGGDAETVISMLALKVEYEPNLVLDGLMFVMENL